MIETAWPAKPKIEKPFTKKFAHPWPVFCKLWNETYFVNYISEIDHLKKSQCRRSCS